jgi:hypothetical protein
MLKNIIFLLLFLVTPLLGIGQTVRTEIQALVDSIAHNNYLKYDDNVSVGTKSKQFMRFEDLTSKATLEELLILTDHKNLVVKCYAIDAYCKKNNGNVAMMKPIIMKSLYDTTIVRVSYDNCYGEALKLSEYVLHRKIYCLSTKDSASILKLFLSIDSVMIHDTTIKLRYKSDALKKAMPNPKNYDRIREIAIKEREPAALIALARYKKQEDIAIIISYLKDKEMNYYAIWAVKEFPDAVFYPFLVGIFKDNWEEKGKEYFGYSDWWVLYQALAQYPSGETINLFKKTANAHKSEKYMFTNCLSVAITRYPHPKFEQFKDKLPPAQLIELTDEYEGAKF